MMMIRTAAVACFLAGLSLPASACLFFSNYKMFAPGAPKTFDWDHAKMNRAVPAPVLSVNRIDRVADLPIDYRTRIESCASGTVSVKVRLPSKSALKLKDAGFRFKRLDAGKGLSYLDQPVKAEIEGNSMIFDFYLFETPDVDKGPLAITLEVYAVNARHQRGPATRLVMRAPAAKPSRVRSDISTRDQQ